jgi:hypothetical protein
VARHYGMPYMGSKQKLVDKLVPFILKRHPNATDFYDPFGGGGSVALYAVRKYPALAVHYNELNQATAALLSHLQAGGHIPDDFVTREQFNAGVHGTDWWAGYLQTCWTFGNNNNTGYLYGKDIEAFKHKFHDTVVYGANNLKWLEDVMANKFDTPTTLDLDFKRYTTPHQRRIVLGRQLPHYNQLEHLSRYVRLLQLKAMPGLDRLAITQGDYSQIKVAGKAPVIYCDPPYEATAKYKGTKFDSKAFYKWVASQQVPVYFSSYKISDTRFKLVKAINTRSLLDYKGRSDASYNYENLYWNGRT